MMSNLYPHLTDRAIKNRFTRLIKKLKNAIPPVDETNTESDTSVEFNSD